MRIATEPVATERPISQTGTFGPIKHKQKKNYFLWFLVFILIFNFSFYFSLLTQFHKIHINSLN